MILITSTKGTATQGLILKLDITKVIECFVGADFAGGWNQSKGADPGSVLYRTGYVIMYANCLIIRDSHLQTKITLSTTEAEYIAEFFRER